MKSYRPGNTLHEAIRLVLETSPGRTASTIQIANQIANRDLYRKKDGTYPEPSQVFLRARKRPELFEMIDREKLRLI